jgi:hypothetical protein
MILNRAQQEQLFAVANGTAPGVDAQSDRPIQTTVEIDGEAIARAVSKQVADGAVLGEFE